MLQKAIFSSVCYFLFILSDLSFPVILILKIVIQNLIWMSPILQAHFEILYVLIKCGVKEMCFKEG